MFRVLFSWFTPPHTDWYIDAEYPELRDVRLPDKKLVPVPSTGKDLVVDIQDMAKSIGYRELYAMARLRRMRDKFTEWRASGYAPSPSPPLPPEIC